MKRGGPKRALLEPRAGCRTLLRKSAQRSPAWRGTRAASRRAISQMTCTHLRRCRLLLKRLGEVIGALSQFVEEPRVLDGNYRLSSEVRD